MEAPRSRSPSGGDPARPLPPTACCKTGDGKVLILDPEQWLRIRTGETGSVAIGQRFLILAHEDVI